MGTTETGCWTGAVADMPVFELFQWLHEGGCTAMLRVGQGLEAGVAFFREGQLYRCEYGRLQGMDAVAALLDLQDGPFCLIQRQFPEPRRNVHVSTAKLLGQPEPDVEATRAAG